MLSADDELNSKDTSASLLNALKECCLEAENSCAMFNFLKNKLIRSFMRACPDYTCSVAFQSLISESISIVEMRPNAVFDILKKVVDQLNIWKTPVLQERRRKSFEPNQQSKDRLSYCNSVLLILKRKIQEFESTDISHLSDEAAHKLATMAENNKKHAQVVISKYTFKIF